MEILYGTKERQIDILPIVTAIFRNGNGVIIPPNDAFRSKTFGDPAPNQVKYVFLKLGNIIFDYDEHVTISIDLEKNHISTKTDTNEYKLRGIHANLQIHAGTYNEEISEQRMACRYLTGNEKVLEIGGNIGRNSCVIGTILSKNNNNNYVVLESDPGPANNLFINRNINGLKFHIEVSALSKRNLIQKDWDTIPSDVLLPGYKKINTITLEELNTKYNIEFDTLVLDCEGAFYYILSDYPEILKKINLVLMENDYINLEHKLFLDEKLRENGFERIYYEAGGWGVCAANFWEAWRKSK